MPTVLAVALGGALGAVARYGIGAWWGRLTVTAPGAVPFPWSTLLINVSGGVLLGVVLRVLSSQPELTPVRAFLAIGLAGGFTTFSTFSYESVLLLQAREYTRATLYMGGSVILSVAGVVAGMMIAGLFTGAQLR